MLTQLLAWTNGKKTYGFIILWAVYKFGIGHGIWGQNYDLEVSLLTGAGLSARDAISKP